MFGAKAVEIRDRQGSRRRTLGALVEHHDPHSWDELVTNFSVTSALQGWGWGEVKAVSGWTPHRLEKTGHFAAQILRKRVAPSLSILYAPRGPALRSMESLPLFEEAVRAWASPTDIYLKIEPEQCLPGDDAIPPRLGCFRYSEPHQPEHTLLLDLTRSPDAMLGGMHQMARRNVKKSLKRGVVTELEHDLDTFWPLFEATNRRSQLLQFHKRYYETVLTGCNAHGGRAFVMSAYYNDTPVASGLFVALKDRIYYLYGGSSRDHTEVRAPYAVHWAVMRYGHEQGYRSYDLWGIPRVLEPNSHAYGVYQFKERFGGTRVRMPAYDLPLSPLYPTIKGALRWRKDWRNLRMRGTKNDVL